jgi:hypothetical protein
MVTYTPEEVGMIIDLLKKVTPQKPKVEKTIKYLEQRRKFLNPPKDMLTFIINYADKFKLNQEIVDKMKIDLDQKNSR